MWKLYLYVLFYWGHDQKNIHFADMKQKIREISFLHLHS